jgi:hypothetical protein
MMAGREHQQWPRLNYSSCCHNYERLDLVALDREAEVQQLNLADRRIAHAERVISAQMLPTLAPVALSARSSSGSFIPP